jgi:hypothetical protein
MEAAVAEKEEGMTEWNDRSLDERFLQIDQRFDQIERKVDDGFVRMDAGFRELNGRFAAMQRTLIQTGGVIIAALIGLIATQV